MTDEPVYKYDFFISYTHTDEEWARRLATRVRQEKWKGSNLRVFFAPWEIRPGESVDERIDRALPVSRYVGLVLSPESVDSKWVSEEWYSKHHADMKRGERRIIPLYRCTCAIPSFIGHLNRIDFRDDDKFEEGVRLLLAVLREEPLPSGESESKEEDISLLRLVNPRIRKKLHELEQLAQERLIDESIKQEYRRKILDKWIDID